jgi:hypothetical protein
MARITHVKGLEAHKIAVQELPRQVWMCSRCRMTISAEDLPSLDVIDVSEEESPRDRTHWDVPSYILLRHRRPCGAPMVLYNRG